MHRVVQDNLEAYLDGTLLPVKLREMDDHLRECASCREQLEDLRQTRGWVQSLVIEEASAPAPGFYTRVRVRIENESSRRLPFWQLLPAFSRQLAFALMILVFLLGGYLYSFYRIEQIATPQIALDAPVIQRETPALTADMQSNRERVMRAIVVPVSMAEGD